jgi:hypothetical protein
MRVTIAELQKRILVLESENLQLGYNVKVTDDLLNQCRSKLNEAEKEIIRYRNDTSYQSSEIDCLRQVVLFQAEALVNTSNQ